MSEVSKYRDTGIQNQFEALFEYATIGMLITNRRGEIENFNVCAESMFGYTRDEINGKTVEILIPDNLHKKHLHLRNGFFSKPENRPMGENRDLFAKRKDGSVFPVEISLSHYNQKEDERVIAFIIDITVRKSNESALLNQQKELKRVSDQIRKLNAELEQKVEDRTKMMKEALSELEHSRQELSQLLQKEKELGDLKSKFVTMASHEFRTPLSTIHSSATLIRKYSRPEDEEKREKHLKRIQDSVENMRDILEDFLSIGRIEEGKVRLQPVKLTVRELAEEIGHLVTEMQMLSKAGQKIEFTQEINTDLEVDLKMLRQVLTNLLSNAIKFSPENAPISLKCSELGENFGIEVSDKGIGIAEEDQKKLFERFFRGENAANIQGTGLGLYLVSRYIDLAKGQIKLESTPGKGTIFRIFLPKRYN